MPSHLSPEYQAYIGSFAWAALRQKVLDRDDHRCRVCNSPDRLDVHHRTYERFGAEDLNDLTTLCRECHDRHHNRRPNVEKRPRRSKSQRKSKKPPREPVPTKAQTKARKLGLENEQLHQIQVENKARQELRHRQ